VGQALRLPNRARLSIHVRIRQAMRLPYNDLIPSQIMPSFVRPLRDQYRVPRRAFGSGASRQLKKVKVSSSI
jgi:hypothetical protein